MKLFTLHPDLERSIEIFESRKVKMNPIMKMDEPAQVIRMSFEAGGILGMHPASCDQLFLIEEGEGWVRTSETEKFSLKAGEAAFWTVGEQHESGTDHGMKVLIFEGDKLSPEGWMACKEELEWRLP